MDNISLLCLGGSYFPGRYMKFSEAYRCNETGDRCDRKCIVTYSVDRKQSELILTRQCPISSEYPSIHIPINPFWSDSLVEDVLKRIFDSSKIHFLEASENYVFHANENYVFQTATEIMKSRIERYRPESKSHYYCENSSGKDGFCTLTANLCGSKEPDCNSCSKLVIKNIQDIGYCIDR